MTESEVAFITRYLPPADFPKLLDVCCGYGRHAARLAGCGYTILGIDKNLDAIRHAQQIMFPNLEFRVHDMRDIESLPGTFNGVLNLWHSFGYFDDATNLDILRQIRDKLERGGRFIFDIYNRSSLERFPATRLVEKEGKQILTEYTWSGNRLTCTLSYNGQVGDTFEWRLYTPDEIQAMTSELSLRCLVACAWFDEQVPPSSEQAHMQFVFEH
jgi:SAM-dependent methyltransferase